MVGPSQLAADGRPDSDPDNLLLPAPCRHAQRGRAHACGRVHGGMGFDAPLDDGSVATGGRAVEGSVALPED